MHSRVFETPSTNEPATAETTFRQYCQGIRSPHVSDGLRCTRCDWMMDVNLSEPPGAPYFPQTGILGHCLLLAGQLDQNAGNRRAAADRYFQAMAYASDLGQGSWPMALAGISTGKRAVRALAQLVSSVQDDALLLRVIRQELSLLQNATPSLNPGLSWDAAHLANHLYEIEYSYLSRQSTAAGRLWPWQAIGAWRLSPSMRLAGRLDAAGAAADLDQLRQLGPQIDMDGVPGRGAVAYALPPNWDALVQEADNVRELLSAVQMTVPLQEWRLAHGGYPASLPFDQASPGYDLSYRPSPDQHAYQFVSRTGAIVLDVNDGASQTRAAR